MELGVDGGVMVEVSGVIDLQLFYKMRSDWAVIYRHLFWCAAATYVIYFATLCMLFRCGNHSLNLPNYDKFFEDNDRYVYYGAATLVS